MNMLLGNRAPVVATTSRRAAGHQAAPSSSLRPQRSGSSPSSQQPSPCSTRTSASPSPASMQQTQPSLLINSCTGKMGKSVGEAAVRAGLQLIPYTFTSAADAERTPTLEVAGHTITPVPPGPERVALIQKLQQQYPNMITVDYTVPDVIHDMVDFYVQHRMPFVMGTTGGDRDRINKQVLDSGLYAVIAPNMGKQIVAFQATMETMAANFPGAFSGYTLRVVESHQSSKKDTSGTAKAVVKSFQAMGLKFDEAQIELVREAEEQVKRMKVPQDALLGHAFHTYQLVSGDGSVMFEFQHNVVGRTTYAEGTVDACLFLARQVGQGAEKKLYNMVDVLRAGSMR